MLGNNAVHMPCPTHEERDLSPVIRPPKADETKWDGKQYVDTYFTCNGRKNLDEIALNNFIDVVPVV